MNISDLNHLEEFSEVHNIVSGGKSYFLKFASVNGKTTVESRGIPLKKKVTKKGSKTTTTYKGSGSTIGTTSSGGKFTGSISVESRYTFSNKGDDWDEND